MAVAPRCRNGKASSYYRGCWYCCCQRHCDWAAGFISHVSLVEILIPFCVMAIANGAITRLLLPGALRPFPHATGRAAALQERSATGSVLPRKSGSFWLIRYQYAIAHHHQRDVINSSAGRSGYMMQRCEEVGCQNHGNAEVAQSESH